MEDSRFDIMDKVYAQMVAEKKAAKKEEECQHPSIFVEGGIKTCHVCARELGPTFIDKEWMDQEGSESLSRVTPRRVDTARGIFSDLFSLPWLTEQSRKEINDLYENVTEGRIYRGGYRQAIISACVQKVLLRKGAIRYADDEMFPAGPRKSFGMELVETMMKKEDLCEISKKTDPLPQILKSFAEFTFEQEMEIREIYDDVKMKSPILINSKPKSIISGVLWYWLVKNEKKFKIKNVAEKIGVSSVTVKKYYKEILKFNLRE